MLLLVLAPAATSVAQAQHSLIDVPGGRFIKPTERKDAVPEPTVGQMKLPPDSVLILCDDPWQAIELIRPKGIVLAPAYYQALLARLARLERGQQGNPPLMLSRCHVAGKVIREPGSPSRGTALLQIELEFRTTAADSLVPLGLQGLPLAGARMDGKEGVPWAPDAAGLGVRVPEPGAHRLELTTQHPVARAGSENRLLIEGLPPAAITSLELVVPVEAREATTATGGKVAVESLAGQGSVLRGSALGSTGKIDLRWTDAEQVARRDDPKLTVHGDTRVTIHGTKIATEARFQLEARAGETTELTWQLPPDVKVLRVEEAGRGEGVEWAHDGETGMLKVRLGRPVRVAAAPVELRFWHLRDIPETGAATAIAPGNLQVPPDAAQSGFCTIALPPDAGYVVEARDLLPIDPRQTPNPDTRTTLAYRYWRLPVHLTLQSGNKPRRRVFEATHRTVLRLSEAAAEVSCTIDLRATLRSLPREVFFEWPVGFQLDRRVLLQPDVEAVAPLNAEETQWRLRFSDGRSSKTQLVLTGRRAVEPGAPFAFRPPGLIAPVPEEGGENGADLLLGISECRLESNQIWTRLNSIPSGWRTKDGQAALLGRPYQGEIEFVHDGISADRDAPWELQTQSGLRTVRADAQVCLSRRELHFLQTLNWRWQGQRPSQFLVSLPTEVLAGGAIRLRHRRAGERGWRLASLDLPLVSQPDGPTRARARIPLPPNVGEEIELIVTITREIEIEGPESVALPWVLPAGRDVSAPMVNVRCWSTRGLRLDPASLPMGWQRLASLPPEDPSDQPPPVLYLAGPLQSDGPTLAVSADPSAPTSDWIVKDVVVTTLPGGGNRPRCQARMRLGGAANDLLTLTFPPAAAGWAIEEESVRINGEPAEFAPRTGDGAPRWKVPAAALSGPLEVEVTYVAPPIGAFLGITRHAWAIPLPGPAARVESITWRVPVEGGRLVLPLAANVRSEDAWRWRWWLRPPEPVPVDHQFVLRFTGGDPSGTWATLAIPKQTALLLGSLAAFVAFMLATSQNALMRWGAITVASGAVVAWLTVIPRGMPFALYAIQPGLYLIVAYGLLRQASGWRWRRDPVPAQAFRRDVSGSSISPVALPSHGPSSTVDVGASAPQP